jgi:hypothetical protein
MVTPKLVNQNVDSALPRTSENTEIKDLSSVSLASTITLCDMDYCDLYNNNKLNNKFSNSHNITQTYNTKINKYLELSVAMRNLWCLEKNSILPLIISATGIVPQSLFKNLKILDLRNTLVVEIQKGILLYSCHIVRKFLNIDTEHNTQQSQNAEARRR